MSRRRIFIALCFKEQKQSSSLAFMSTPIDFKTEKDTMSKILEHIDLEPSLLSPLREWFNVEFLF